MWNAQLNEKIQSDQLRKWNFTSQYSIISLYSERKEDDTEIRKRDSASFRVLNKTARSIYLFVQ